MTAAREKAFELKGFIGVVRVMGERGVPGTKYTEFLIEPRCSSAWNRKEVTDAGLTL
jgi:hypothetical protein